MAKTMHFIHATDINQLFKQEGMKCILHLRAGCLTCSPVLECEEKELEKAYEVMNNYLQQHMLKVKPNEIDTSVVEVY